MDTSQKVSMLTNTRNLQNNSSDESDADETKILPKQPEIKKRVSKNGALWKEMLEEENLMEGMNTCEVAKNARKRKVDRGAESYHYNEEDEYEKRPRFEKIHESTSSVPKKKDMLTKGHHHHHIDKSPKFLDDLTVSEEMSDKEFAEDVAYKLDETNVTLIEKVVEAIGREECAAYYNKTKKMEYNGGLLTVNKQRRRTSGGIFLFLLKTSNKLTKEQREAIFDDKKKDVEG